MKIVFDILRYLQQLKHENNWPLMLTKLQVIIGCRPHLQWKKIVNFNNRLVKMKLFSYLGSCTLEFYLWTYSGSRSLELMIFLKKINYCHVSWNDIVSYMNKNIPKYFILYIWKAEKSIIKEKDLTALWGMKCGELSE